jgi:hypothetical protein
MKIRQIILMISFITGFTAMSNSQDTIFFENFDDSPGEKPDGWTTELEVMPLQVWQFVNGGGAKPPVIPGSRRPPTAYSGLVNALFFFESLKHESVILLPPPINLEYAVKPELRFRHAQMYGNLGFGGANDELRIYYKTHIDSAWRETRRIAQFTDSVNSWREQTVLIPSGAYVPNCYFGFKATTNYGWGVCIDDVTIVETGVQARYVDAVTIQQENTNIIPTGSKNNPVLRINISVKGNSGSVTLNSIKVKSLNTSDSDVPANGVRLFYNTSSRNFYAAELFSSVSFSAGEATFSGLNLDLPTGSTSVWITCDVKAAAVHGNIIDASISANNININGTTYPTATVSPTGTRTIRKSVFYDDFATDQGWTLSGDFERNRPHGYGGDYIGNPDPAYASGDTMIIGDDLTGLGYLAGDYEPNVPRYENLAVSPLFDAFYFNDVRLSFLRWLNVENSDTASIEISTDNGVSWNEIWSNNNNVFTDNDWKFFSLTMPLAYRKPNVKLRFNLGPTNMNNHFSGWNIEDFAITANYVDYDVGPITMLSPGSGCGHSSAETVTIRVKNFGPAATPNRIPLRYSFNGGSTWTTDTIKSVIPLNGETNFSFAKSINLSAPGTYNVLIETRLGVDEESTNNTFDTVVYVDPTYPVPYMQNFEVSRDFWRSGGTLSSWEYGKPSGSIIIEAASGTKAWVTKLAGNYNDGEDSWLLSPCFDFTGIDYPVFECKLFTFTEDDKDGADMEYSLDNGQTWSRLGNKGDGETYSWNWYNSDSIEALSGKQGWTGSTSKWVTSRILLDTAVFRNVSGVKFRFHFASDSINRLEGIGVDDIRIYDAPRDAGVVSIESPVTACAQDIGDHVAVTIKNFGLDTLMAGDSIIVGYDFDGNPTVIEKFALASNLKRNGSVQYIFKNDLITTTSGSKKVTAFTLLPDDARFYNEIFTNDTASKTINVAQTPFLYLPSAIYTVRPDTVILDAYTGNPTDTYLWQDNSTNSKFQVTLKADGIYHVRASNGICDYRDTTYIYHLIADAGVASVPYPQSDCELGNAVAPRILIKNFGTDTMDVNDVIIAAYQLDTNPAVEETIILTEEIYPDSTIEYVFLTAVDMSEIRTYSFKAYTRLTDDDLAYNDTTSFALEVYGFPTIDIGPDVLSPDIEYTIDAGAGWSSYFWQDSSTNRYFTVVYHDRTPDNKYTVTVNDEHGCPATDDIIVSFEVWDITITDIISPLSACVLTDQEEFRIRIQNSGTIAIYNEQIKMVAIIDNGVPRNGQRTLTQVLNGGESFEFSFGTNFNFSRQGDHPVRVYTIYSKDMDSSNDTLDMVIHHYGYPVVDLGGINDTLHTSLPYLLDGGAGFDQYIWNGVEGSQIYTVTIFGRVTLEAEDMNGCSDSDTVIIMPPAGIEDPSGISRNLNIFPNPSDNMIYIELNLPDYTDILLELCDATGRKIYIREFSRVNGIHESMDISNLPAGLYWLKVGTKKGLVVRNIVVI